MQKPNEIISLHYCDLPVTAPKTLLCTFLVNIVSLVIYVQIRLANLRNLKLNGFYGSLAHEICNNKNFSNPQTKSVDSHPRKLYTKFQDFLLGGTQKPFSGMIAYVLRVKCNYISEGWCILPINVQNSISELVL